MPSETEQEIREKQVALPEYNPLRSPGTFQPGFRALEYIAKKGGIFIDGDSVGSYVNKKLDANVVSFVNNAEMGNEKINTGSDRNNVNYKYNFGYSKTIKVLLYTPKDN